MASALRPDMFREEYASVFEGDDVWKKLPVPEAEGGRFAWDPQSTYVAEPPYFKDLPRTPGALRDVAGARVLAWLGDSVTTDHISPAGAIPKDSPAGRWLMEHGVKPVDFNTFGSRRGHHDVMMRGTFGNIRIKNRLVEPKEGNWSVHVPSGEVAAIYDVAMRYAKEGVPLIVLAGKEYGTGSSRDWAAKGPALQGVRAVIAESYERIHRSNLIGMGVLPLQFQDGQSAASLGLTGKETFALTGIASGLKPGGTVRVSAQGERGKTEFDARVRLDTPIELEYSRHGGILPYVLRQLLK
jgi:aconitate hydratase